MVRDVDLQAAVRKAAAAAGVDGAVILAAVSGGPDSLAMLHALNELAGELGIESLAVAHYDHGLRGESAAEAEFVTNFCRTLALPCHVETAVTGAIAASSRGSLQEAARDARYAFLERIAVDTRAKFIVTAHNQDDQVETVLINILRGTGIDGLRGIPRLVGHYLRPLLDVDRATIEAYCANHGLAPRRDPSNDDSKHYLRNRIRLELLPLLELDYHPSARESILRLSESAAIDTAYLDDLARAAFESLRRVHPAVAIDHAGLTALPHALRRRVVRLAVETARGTREGLTERQVEQTLALAAGVPGTTGFTIASPECRVLRRGDCITFEATVSAAPAVSYSVALASPSNVTLDTGWTINVDTAPIDGVYTATIDARCIDLPTLVVRSRRDGDRIDPLGMTGRSKKLQDAFVDARIARSERDRWPIIADKNGPVWIPGLTLSDRAKVTEQTTQPLTISATDGNRAPV